MKIIINKLHGKEEIDTSLLLDVLFVSDEGCTFAVSMEPTNREPDPNCLKVRQPTGMGLYIVPEAANSIYVFQKKL